MTHTITAEEVLAIWTKWGLSTQDYNKAQVLKAIRKAIRQARRQRLTEGQYTDFYNQLTKPYYWQKLDIEPSDSIN